MLDPMVSITSPRSQLAPSTGSVGPPSGVGRGQRSLVEEADRVEPDLAVLGESLREDTADCAGADDQTWARGRIRDGAEPRREMIPPRTAVR